MVPRFRKTLALEVSNRGSTAAAAAERLAFLSGSKENSRANATRESTLTSDKVIDDDAAEHSSEL
jgi:hypothetical protein